MGVRVPGSARVDWGGGKHPRCGWDGQTTISLPAREVRGALKAKRVVAIRLLHETPAKVKVLLRAWFATSVGLVVEVVATDSTSTCVVAIRHIDDLILPRPLVPLRHIRWGSHPPL